MRIRLLRIGGGFSLFCGALLAQKGSLLSIALYVLGYLLSGYDVLYKAGRGLFSGAFISENALMSIATLGAFAIGEYPEGVLVMLLYQVGEVFQSYAVGKSRRSIGELMDIRPDVATVLRDGVEEIIDGEEVRIGDVMIIRPGERVPLDGMINKGQSSLDMAALTGEPVPRSVGPGDVLLSGSVNLSGLLTAEVTKGFEESTASRILELVENASGSKSRSERFITRFARVYTPLVVALAALLAILPPLLLGQAFSIWVYRALSFLVVSCPCALVISVPLTFFGGIGGASRQGILIKGGNDLEVLSQAEIIAFDKTGTLTQGVFDVQAVHSDMGEEALLALAALAESGSNHPIAHSILRAYGQDIPPERIAHMEEIRGYGVRAVVDGRAVLVGSARFLMEDGITPPKDDCAGTVVHVAADGQYAGHLLIADAIKADAQGAMVALRQAGAKRLVMLTGDGAETASRVADALGLSEVRAELLPGDKLEAVEALLKEPGRKGSLIFVGDGMNDAPVLKRADVGVAMGALGSDAAVEAADVVIMTDEPSKLPVAIRIAKDTMAIARQNIAFALGVKGLVLLLSALGLTTMMAAVFADVGVTVLAILNALRALRKVG